MATTLAISECPLIYLISDGTLTDENFTACSTDFLELVAVAVKTKVSLIQIREKQLSARNLFLLTRRAVRLTSNSHTLLLVNDRADIALSAGADGVHLNNNSLTVKVVRQSFPKNFLIGVSCHSLPEVIKASEDAANFATFSPIFVTPSKTKYDLPPQGLEKLKEVCLMAEEFPVIALGGINETNFSAVLQAGVDGIAAIRFLNDPQNLSKIVSKIRNDQ